MASWRQGMLNGSGLTDAENAAYLKLTMRESKEEEAEKLALCEKIVEKPLNNPEDAAKISARGFLFGCASGPTDDIIWSMVRRKGTFPNALVALAQSLKCMGASYNWIKLNERDRLYATRMASFAMCSHDLKVGLDKKAIVAEIKAQKLSAFEEVMIVEQYSLAKMYSDGFVEAYAAAAKKHPGLHKVLYEAPMHGFEEWVRQAKRWAPQLKLASDYEFRFFATQNSKKELKSAFAGYRPPLQKALTDYVIATKAKTAEDFRRAASDPIGVELLLALTACDAIEERPFIARAHLDFVLGENHALAGPRAAAYAAAVRALGDIESDRNDFIIKVEGFRISLAGATRSWANDAYMLMGEGGKGEGTFTDQDSKSTAQMPVNIDGQIAKVIDRVEWSGSGSKVLYVQNCKVVGQSPRTSQVTAIVVPEGMATGLKPGMSARVYAKSDFGLKDGELRPGFVLEAFADKTRKKLVHVAGIVLQ